MGPCYIMSLCVCQHSEEMYFYHLSFLCYYNLVMHSRRKMARYLHLIGANTLGELENCQEPTLIA